ncbi:putative tRNA threonylcarbamoyladenosine dehydratase 1 [Blattamonas nauphoetae]|uniref:tRNA threonylcarbamoyladenosine dehydratase 1 n=1 Tax=Blattamonas nauphoetae TaxID=2049346 RepID=A0ABQ9X894_9EUKA|nr:putative tRNA threonylcarbamoyladenosine dehydratase 1 [Blattamonas nauphoetae]
MSVSTSESGNLSKFVPQEMWVRTNLLFGDTRFGIIRKSCVAVIGVGGVGSAVVHTLARSGIQHLRFADPKPIDASTLNRHVCAVWSDIGRSKTDVLAEYLRRINPQIDLRTETKFFLASRDGPAFFEGVDIVVDCIDDVPTKIDLLAYCVHHSIPVVSCMGGATRVDALHVTASDLSKTHSDPLCVHVKQQLHKIGIESGIRCVYSTESPIEGLRPLTEQDRKALQAKKQKEMKSEEPSPSERPSGSTDTESESEPEDGASRIRILPSAMVVPSAVGNIAAGEVLMMLTHLKHIPDNALPARHIPRSMIQLSEQREKQLCFSLQREVNKQKSHNDGKISTHAESFCLTPSTAWMNQQLVALLLSTSVWSGQSPFSPPSSTKQPSTGKKSLQIHSTAVQSAPPQRKAFCLDQTKGALVLMRWNVDRPFSPTNAVLMTTTDAKQLENDSFLGGKKKGDVFKEDEVEFVETMLNETIPNILKENGLET